MKARNEWGEFFPPSLSPFGYNHSVAIDYYPLTKEEAVTSGFEWNDYQSPAPQISRVLDAKSLPSTPERWDEIAESTIRCDATGKLFKLTKAEIEFYKLFNLPPPIIHPDERQKRRLQSRNARMIWDRECDSCRTTVSTTYSPNQKEKVMCRECYERALY